MKRRRFVISIASLAVLGVLCFAATRAARADRGEASVHAQVQYGRATVGEPDAPDDTDTATFTGTGVRATYAVSNWYAFEASLGHGRLGDQTVHTVDTKAGDVQRSWHQTWFQAALGISVRFGVRVIPTLHAGLGLQRRAWQGGRQNQGFSPICPPKLEDPSGNCWYPSAERGALEFVGTLGAGLDYRLGSQWIAGVNMAAQRDLLAEAHFHAIAVTFHFSYYFYPEGAGP